MGFSDSLPGNLPAGLAIAGGLRLPRSIIRGGTLTAVSGTQLIDLVNGTLAGNASCTIVVSITGSTAGDYQNTISAGALITDQGVTNSLPGSDHLVVTSSSGGGGNSTGGGKRGRGNNNNQNQSAVPTSGFIIPVTGFAPEMITKLDSSSHPAYDTTSLTIEIPVIKVNTSIVGVEIQERQLGCFLAAEPGGLAEWNGLPDLERQQRADCPCGQCRWETRRIFQTEIAGCRRIYLCVWRGISLYL